MSASSKRGSFLIIALLMLIGFGLRAQVGRSPGVTGGSTAAGAITSVFGRTGVVVSATNDYSFAQLSGSIATTQLPSGTLFGVGTPVNLTAQTANVGTTNLTASTPATGWYRIVVYGSLTTVGTTSTFPSFVAGWTDADSSVVESQAITSTASGNTLGLQALGTYDLYALTGTAITVRSSGYATTGGPMQYSFRAYLQRVIP